MKVINIPSGNAHFQFDTDLAGTRLRIRCDWLTRWEYFLVSISRGSDLLATGRALHPDIDLLKGLELGIGTLQIEGRPPTPENLGNRNQLVFREAE